MGRCRQLQGRGDCLIPRRDVEKKKGESATMDVTALALRAHSREEERRAVSYGGGRDLCDL